jgi:hypothetical protein
MNPKNIILFLSCIIIITPLFSQTDSSTFINRKAITFSFSGLNLSGGISGRYWITNQQCVRIGVNGAFETMKDNSTVVDSNDYRIDETVKDIGINASIANYFSISNNLAPYIGLSVGYLYSNSYMEYIYLYKTHSSDSKRYTYSGGVFIGIEYWLLNNISLSGEQQIRVSYNNEYNSTTWRVSNSTSSLLLSLYF